MPTLLSLSSSDGKNSIAHPITTTRMHRMVCVPRRWLAARRNVSLLMYNITPITIAAKNDHSVTLSTQSLGVLQVGVQKLVRRPTTLVSRYCVVTPSPLLINQTKSSIAALSAAKKYIICPISVLFLFPLLIYNKTYKSIVVSLRE